MEIGCQFCGSTVAPCDDNCRCRTTYEGFDSYNPFYPDKRLQTINERSNHSER